MSSGSNSAQGQKYRSYTDPLRREITLVRKEGKLSAIHVSLFRKPFRPRDDSLRLGILGDLHGHVTLVLQKLREQCELSGLYLDAILQTDDIGRLDYTSLLDPTQERSVKKTQMNCDLANASIGLSRQMNFLGTTGFSGIPRSFCTRQS